MFDDRGQTELLYTERRNRKRDENDSKHYFINIIQHTSKKIVNLNHSFLIVGHYFRKKQ